MYSDKYAYTIVAVDRAADEGYLGCVYNCRQTRIGESRLRGGDLPDGEFNIETWRKIKDAILANELVKIEKFKKIKYEIADENNESLPPVGKAPPMPEGVKPPKGGSGVRERISYRDKAKMTNALGRVLHADNIIFGVNGIGFNTKIKNKIEKILENV